MQIFAAIKRRRHYTGGHKKLKKIVSFFFVLCTLIAIFSVVTPAAQRTVTVYNWGQYIGTGEDDTIDVIAEFEAKTGIKVNYITYDSNETLWTKLEMGGSNYDVIIPSDYMIGRLIANDMLEKINFDNVPNYANIPDAYKSLDYDPNNEYSVPYTFGTVGIIYNTKYVTKEITSWESLWDPDYAGYTLMFDNARDAFGIAELRLGYDLNTEEPAEFEECYKLLLEQKPVLQSYVMDQIFDLLESGEAWIAPYYAGDYMTMSETNPDLAFCFPDEGFNYFVDAMCIPKGAKNKTEAEEFINFMCDPEIAGRNADAIGYATPVDGAKEYLDEEWANSPVVYPSEEVLKNGRTFNALSTEANQKMDELWTRLRAMEISDIDSSVQNGQTTAKNDYMWVAYCLGGYVVGALVTWIFMHREYRKRLCDDKDYYKNK